MKQCEKEYNMLRKNHTHREAFIEIMLKDYNKKDVIELNDKLCQQYKTNYYLKR